MAGHDSHFGDHVLIHMYHQSIQPFIQKAGNSVSFQPNDNDPSVKLNYHCSDAKESWMLKYGMKKMLPHHMNLILVEEWDAFNVSARKFIRESFVKTTLPPPTHPSGLNYIYPGMFYLLPIIFWSQF